jgi:hypothetical protein
VVLLPCLLHVSTDSALRCINARTGISQKQRRGRDTISGHYVTLSLIMISAPNNCLHFNRNLVKGDKCVLATQEVSGKLCSAVCDSWKPKKEKKMIQLDLIELPYRNHLWNQWACELHTGTLPV